MPAILFIAPSAPGEAVLATAALEALRGAVPEARVTVVCTRAARPLFRAWPGLASIHAWSGSKGAAERLALAGRFFGRSFDVVLDLERTPVGFGVRAGRRITRGQARTLQHLLADFAELVGEPAVTPKLYIDDRARADAANASDAAPMLALAPGGPVARRWPVERFAAVARRLVSAPLAGAEIVLLGEQADADVTRAVATSLLSDGLAAKDLAGRLDLLASAALLERATLAIGNDNAFAHAAAVMGAPTLALFGPTDERVRGPVGPRVRLLRGRPYEDIMAARDTLDERALLDDITIDAAEEIALDLLRAGGL